jgi:tetratricopeptide (TPR) repeat protein
MHVKILFLLLVLIAASSACSTSAGRAGNNGVVLEKPPAASKDIADALEAIDKSPNSAAGYTKLSVAYVKEARVSGDFTFNKKAERAITEALRLDPANLQARKIRASLYLTFHRFADGLALGKELEKEVPADPFVLGVITDAQTELGNYPEAVIAAQKLIDQKPNSSGYARVAHLRSLHGDHAGAVELYKMAARTADPMDKEAQSWALSQLGDEYWRNGKFADAEKVYDEAISLLPEYTLALAGKGRVRASVGDLVAGAELLARANAKAPHTQTIVLLGDIYSKLGNTEEAAKQYGLAEVENELFDAHRVALHWADLDINLEKALEIAQADYDNQQDIYAADTLAWCLLKNGKLNEAKSMIKEAMRLKTKDAKILYHAGMIEIADGDTQGGVKLLKEALKLNPGFDLLNSAAAKDAVSKFDRSVAKSRS